MSVNPTTDGASKPRCFSAGFAKLGTRFGKLRKADDGTTAIEFAMVATPFLMFVFGLIGCAFYFFIVSSVEKGMDQASRLVRTGQAQSSLMTVNQFKQKICDGAGAWVTCSKMQIFVQKFADWNSVTPTPCVNKGVVATNTAPGSALIALYSGTANQVVIVTACYKWGFTASLPFVQLGNMSDGSLMMQSATAFRSEPYPGGS